MPEKRSCNRRHNPGGIFHDFRHAALSSFAAAGTKVGGGPVTSVRAASVKV
jgi:hypothetical protein